MRIAFICGSLEPGHDGVGDYTRRLAAQCLAAGHEAAILSLFDRHQRTFARMQQPEGHVKVEVARIPEATGDAEKKRLGKAFIETFDPDWLSLQFVIFSFHPKGLPLHLSSLLLGIGGRRKWNVMFHELWVGMPEGATRKHRCWGELQRLLILRLLNKVRPALIHTHSTLYRAQLAGLGYPAHSLPLFSNIPVTASTNPAASLPPNPVRLVIFGSIHPDAPVAEFISEAARFSKEEKRIVMLTMIGRNGSGQQAWKDACTREGLPLEVLGEQSPARLSEVLASSTLGIATGAYIMIEKSGTVAAMLEHGLPVLCVASHWKARGLDTSPEVSGVVRYQPGNFKHTVTWPPVPAHPTVTTIALGFLNDLQGVYSSHSGKV